VKGQGLSAYLLSFTGGATICHVPQLLLDFAVIYLLTEHCYGWV